MKKKLKPIPYHYLVHTIVDGDEIAYKAVIPALDGAIVFDDTLTGLEQSIREFIEDDHALRKKRGVAIPSPDTGKRYSGKFMVRLEPRVHEQLALQAKAEGKSLNAYIKHKIGVV